MQSDLIRFNSIMNTQTYLTQEEYDFCFSYDKSIREDTSYIGGYSNYGDYLNLRVYSERDHDKRQYEMETEISEEEWEANSLYCS